MFKILFRLHVLQVLLAGAEGVRPLWVANCQGVMHQPAAACLPTQTGPGCSSEVDVMTAAQPVQCGLPAAQQRGSSPGCWWRLHPRAAAGSGPPRAPLQAA